jgi:hypothetical protein
VSSHLSGWGQTQLPGAFYVFLIVMAAGVINVGTFHHLTIALVSRTPRGFPRGGWSTATGTYMRPTGWFQEPGMHCVRGVS